MKSEVKHIALLTLIIILVLSLAFSLEISEINSITHINIEGESYLSADEYLEFSQLSNKELYSDMSISLIRDRIEKHPYIENVDVIIEERGTVKITVFEKKMEAILFSRDDSYFITNKAEILPFISSTKNINLPVIICENGNNKIKEFDNAKGDPDLYSALKIISTAQLFDYELYRNLSEIDIKRTEGASLLLTNFESPILFGKGMEVEKTVYLSKIYKQLSGKDLSDYVNYVDLRYTDLVYIGLDKELISVKEKI